MERSIQNGPEQPGDGLPDLDQAVQAGRTYVEALMDQLLPQLASASAAYQLGLIVLTGALARLLAARARTGLDRAFVLRRDDARLFRIHRTLSALMVPVIWTLLLWLATVLVRRLGEPDDLMRIGANLLLAWVVIRLVTSVLVSRVWARFFTTLVWTVAALNILRLLDPTIAFLDSIGFQLGEFRLSLFVLVKGAVIAAVLIWLAATLSSAIQSRLARTSQMSGTSSGLVAQLLRFLLIVIAVAVALGAIGIDLTALAVFTGAVGVGVGIGLQTIFSNFMSGVILLMERSLRVGDFVELEEGVRGQVREINFRSVLITTNDNIDILVPNSEFIDKRVTNWTMRDTVRRLRIPFGVAYASDKEVVRQAGLEAADAVPFTLKGIAARKPQVWLVGFGDSALDFELVVWLTDEATKRPAAVQAAYYWELHSALERHGITIPFPQRDLHLIPPADLAVRLDRPDP